jgi:hypothetical protein
MFLPAHFAKENPRYQNKLNQLHEINQSKKSTNQRIQHTRRFPASRCSSFRELGNT